MSDINEALKLVLLHEGGYVDNPADSGGPTKYGITQADMPGVNIQTITEADAIEYYKEHYVKPLFSEIESQSVMDKCLDLCVLFGVDTAVRILQRTLGIPEDGEFGPNTLTAVNAQPEDSLLLAYKTQMVAHIFKIIEAHPEDRQFAAGWGNRVNS